MADFCWQATETMFGKEFAPKNDMRNLCRPGETVTVLCEGDGVYCKGGYHEVDHEGRRVDETLADQMLD